MDTNKLGEALWCTHLDHVRALEQLVEGSRARGESGLLLYLFHVGQPMFPGTLTERLGLTTGRIANILKSLERSGLVERTPDREDKRRVLVALTPRGEALARAQNQAAVDFHAKLVSHLSEAEAQQFIALIQRIALFIEDEGAQPRP